MSVVEQAIEDGVGDRGFTDPGMPVLDRQLRGNDGGAPVAAIIDQLAYSADVGRRFRVMPATCSGACRPGVRQGDVTLVDEWWRRQPA